MANINRTLEDIKARYGRKVARAFADAIADVRSNVVLRRVIRALERNDIQAAINALNIDEAVFAQVRAALTETYNISGEAVIAATRFSPPRATRAVVRWDVTNPVAERFIREVLGTSITRITNETLLGAREAMADGFARGMGPRQIALDVVGRVGPNGTRVGGMIGLNGPQIALKQRIDQTLSGNLRDYFVQDRKTGKMKPRWPSTSRAFDRTILKAIREGRELTANQIAKIQAGNNNKALKLRGDTIARTETAGAVEQARIDGFRVGMDKEGYPAQYVIKKWMHGGGGMKPRQQHVTENEQTVIGIDTPFVMADGTLLQRPHDPNAPAKHVINCTCNLIMDIDWRGMKRDGLL